MRRRQRIFVIAATDLADRMLRPRGLTRTGMDGLLSKPPEEVLMQATTMVTTGDGRALAVCEWGPPDGSPVFWLHGTPGSRYLRHPGDRYERAGLRVLTYDRPGYGESTRAVGRKVSDAAADVTAIADAFDIPRFGVAGVSGGGPPALGVAALARTRVTRCAAIVSGPPLDADGLNFFADLEEEDREFWRGVREHGEEYLLNEFEDTASWVRSGMPDLKFLPPDYQEMLQEAFVEGVRSGPWGFVDDFLALVAGWGFAIDDVVAPTKVMLARDDTSIPRGHAEWLSHRLPNGEVVWVGGDHFGPRDREEMELLRWVSGV
jgi:pimeloyl-ACP methyl ester carboxylesterase